MPNPPPTDTFFIGETSGGRYQYVSQKSNGRLIVQPVDDMTPNEAYEILAAHPARIEFVAGNSNYTPQWDYTTGAIIWLIQDNFETAGALYYGNTIADPTFERALKIYWEV